MKMRVPKSRLGQFIFGFIVEFISFFIIVANTRAYTHGNYTWTILTDTLFSLQSFWMAKLMIDKEECRSWWFGLGFTVGGTCGSCCAIFVTQNLLHY